MNKCARYFLIVSVAFIFMPNAFAEIDVIKTAQQLNPVVYMLMRDKPEAEKLEKLDNLEHQIKDELVNDPNRPELYWLLGLHAWAKLYALDKPVSLEKNRAQKAIASEMFRKALELDDSDNLSLSVDMLYSLKKFGSSDVHVEAGRRILEEDPNIDPKKELEVRGGIAVHYVRLGRYDEALQVFDEFEKKYPGKYTSDLQFKRNFHNKKIEEAKQAVLTKKTEQAITTEPAEARKSESVISTTKQQPVVKTEDVQENHKDLLEADNNKAFIIGIVLAVLLLIGFVAVKRKKK